MAERFQRQALSVPQVAQTGDLSSLAQRLGAARQASGTAFNVVAGIAQEEQRVRSVEAQAAAKAFQGSMSNDILEGVSRIKAESNTEEEFNAKVTGFKEGLATDVPPEFSQDFELLFDNVSTRARIELNSIDVDRQQAEDKVMAQQGIDSFRKEATKAAFSGDLETLEFSRNGILSLLDNPSFTPSEIGDTLRELDAELDEQQVLGTVDSLYNEDPRKALIAISTFQNSKDLPLEPDEQKRITALAYQGVLNRTKLSESLEKIEDDDNEAFILANEKDLSVKAFSGELSEPEFLNALKDRRIDAAAADRIRKRMNNVSAVKDNPNVLLDIERQFPDLSSGELEVLLDNAVTDGNLTTATVSRLQRNINQRDKTEEDADIKNNRDLLKGFLTEQGIFTAFDPGKEKRLAAGMAQYNERTLAGEDPNAVVLDVLNQNTEQNELVLRTLPKLRFGTAEDLGGSRVQVVNAADNGTITDEEAERQLKLIQTMEGLKLRFTKK